VFERPSTIRETRHSSGEGPGTPSSNPARVAYRVDGAIMRPAASARFDLPAWRAHATAWDIFRHAKLHDAAETQTPSALRSW